MGGQILAGVGGGRTVRRGRAPGSSAETRRGRHIGRPSSPMEAPEERWTRRVRLVRGEGRGVSNQYEGGGGCQEARGAVRDLRTRIARQQRRPRAGCLGGGRHAPCGISRHRPLLRFECRRRSVCPGPGASPGPLCADRLPRGPPGRAPLPRRARVARSRVPCEARGPRRLYGWQRGRLGRSARRASRLLSRGSCERGAACPISTG